MAILATCACGKQYTLKDELAGKRAKCKACGQTFTIPAPGAEEIVDLAPAPEPTTASKHPADYSSAGGGIVAAGLADHPTANGYQPFPGAGASPQNYSQPAPAQPGFGQAGFGQPAYGPQGYAQQSYPQQSFGQPPLNPSSFGMTPAGFGQQSYPGQYDPLAAQPAYGGGLGQPFGAPPAKAGSTNSNQPLIIGGISLAAVLLIGGLMFFVTRVMFSRPNRPVAASPVSSPPAVPSSSTPATNQTVAAPNNATPPSNAAASAPNPAATPSVASTSGSSTSTAASNPPSVAPATWTAALDPAIPSPQPLLDKPINVELNPTDIERVTLTAPSVGRAVVGSRKANKGRLLVYDLVKEMKLVDWEAPKYGPAIQITSLSPNGEYFAFSTATQETEVWSVKDNQQVAAFKAVQGSDGLTSFVAMLDDGRMLSGSTNGTIALWKFASGPEKIWNKEKQGHFGFNGLGGHVALSPNRKFLAVFREGKCELLNVETGVPHGQLTSIPNLPSDVAINALSFHPAGKRLLALLNTPTSHNSLLVIWDLQSGAIEQSFPIAVGQQLNISGSFLKRANDPPPTWRVSSGLHKAIWWGDQHVLLGNQHVVDLATRDIVARLRLSWGGIADMPLGDRICYASGAQPHQPGQLSSLAVPTASWQAALAAQQSGESWLKPGARIGLQLELDGPPTDAGKFRDEFTQLFKARLAASGYSGDGAPELTYSMRTRTETTDVTYRVHSFGGRGGPPQEIKGRRLICNVALNAGGQPVWQRELKYDPPFAFSANGQEDFAAAQLNAHWTTASQDVLNLFPWCLPKDSGLKPLPAELTLGPDGVQ